MARSRNIKPGFFKNEDLAECSPWARLCFAGLWTLADREGRLEDRPKRIKGELFAYDTTDVESLLADLARRGFVVRYEVEGSRFIQISKFSEHQTPHYTEKPSVIKPPPLPESEPLRANKTPGVKAALRGGQNPLIPDSLIPDSRKEKGARKRAPSFDASRIELPAWLDAELWSDWVADRKERGRPITERGAQQQLVTLDEFRRQGSPPERVIRHAIASGNQGLFPPPRPKPNGADAVHETVPPRETAGEQRRRLDADRMTPEQKISAEKARVLAISAFKNITPKATA